MIHSITIDNFRGIKHLDINGFRKVNLLVGENGSGKSTVLESLFIARYPTNPNLLFGLNTYRLLDINDWNYVFHKNGNNEITLKLNDTNGIEHCLHISRYEEANTQLKTSLNPDSNLKKGMKFSYRQNGGDEYSAIVLPEEENPITIVREYRTEFSMSYLPANFMMNSKSLSELSNELIAQNREEKLIEFLKKINPKLTQIKQSNNQLYVVVDNVALPVNLMGDGFLKVLTVALSFEKACNGVIVIDEIDNGLHYSSLEVMWKAVFAAAREFKVQVFATTHSWECVGTFSEAEGLDDDDICLFRLDKFDEEHYATTYARDLIQAAMEGHIEVR